MWCFKADRVEAWGPVSWDESWEAQLIVSKEIRFHYFEDQQAPVLNPLGLLLRGKLLAHDHQSRCGAALNHLQSVPKASLVSCFAEANGRQKAETVGCPRRKGQDSANRGFDDTASAVALLERLPFQCIGWLVGWMDGCMDGWMDLFDDGPESAA